MKPPCHSDRPGEARCQICTLPLALFCRDYAVLGQKNPGSNYRLFLVHSKCLRLHLEVRLLEVQSRTKRKRRDFDITFNGFLSNTLKHRSFNCCHHTTMFSVLQWSRRLLDELKHSSFEKQLTDLIRMQESPYSRAAKASRCDFRKAVASIPLARGTSNHSNQFFSIVLLHGRKQPIRSTIVNSWTNTNPTVGHLF